MTIRCNDCYEENDPRSERCARCGRLLEESRQQRTRDQYEFQHFDAPNVVRKDRSARKVW